MAKNSPCKSAGKQVAKKAASKSASKKAPAKKAASKKVGTNGTTSSFGGHRLFCRECNWRGKKCMPTINAALEEGVRLHGDPRNHAIDTESC